ncbi:MAG TPA: hypothetical protein VGQ26_14545 [Streptosporangiaceae bacterium]|jgi:hypothetical protein|nr:hypothetical protein [Streptosporangiaceae bacterium]
MQQQPPTPFADPTIPCPACLGLPECVGGCGTCGETGEVAQPPGRGEDPMASTSSRFTATDKQYALIAKLLRERHESSPRRRYAISSALHSKTLTKAQASAAIAELLTWSR